MQLEDYALGQMEYKTNLGYVKRECRTLASHTQFPFTAVGKARIELLAIYIIFVSGFFFQVVFVWIVSAVLLKMAFKGYAQKTFTYSYDMYGMFWGVSTTAVGFFGIYTGVYVSSAFMYIVTHKNNYWQSQYVPLIIFLFIILVLELSVAIYTTRKATVAVPCIFRYPASLLCCGRKRRAKQLVTTIALWVEDYTDSRDSHCV